MCTCKSDIEEKLFKKVTNDCPEYIDTDITIEGYDISLGKEQRGAFNIKFNANYLNENNCLKEINISQKLIFTYCPFCGVKYSPRNICNTFQA